MNKICNYCAFKKMEELSVLQNGKISKKKHPHGKFSKGVDIFFTDKDRKKEWMVWMRELPSKCECLGETNEL